MGVHVAFQGEFGAYSEEAVRCLVPDGMPVPCPSFEDVFDRLTGHGVDLAVVPIENSRFGSVAVNYDLLAEHDVHIRAELPLRICHQLLALPGTQLADVHTVRSHPQALGQSMAWMRSQLPNVHIVADYDTAGAAKRLRDEGRKGEAAIASRRAADVYGLDILASDLEADATNTTRFLLLARGSAGEGVHADRPGKTSLVFTLPLTAPGALYRALAAFAHRDVDLHRIESRPRAGKPGHYRFFVDVAGYATDLPLQRALRHLDEMADTLRVLGSYPATPWMP